MSIRLDPNALMHADKAFIDKLYIDGSTKAKAVESAIVVYLETSWGNIDEDDMLLLSDATNDELLAEINRRGIMQ